jgi:hypothetical protein
MHAPAPTEDALTKILDIMGLTRLMHKIASIHFIPAKAIYAIGTDGPNAWDLTRDSMSKGPVIGHLANSVSMARAPWPESLMNIALILAALRGPMIAVTPLARPSMKVNMIPPLVMRGP